MSSEKTLWTLIEAIVLILLGLAALAAPLLTGLIATSWLGWMLLMVGIVRLASAMSMRGEQHRAMKFVSAFIAIAFALLIIGHPLLGAFGIDGLLAGYLIIDGLGSLGLWRHLHAAKTSRFGWVLASAVLELLLGSYLFLQGPLASVVVVGCVVGLSLLSAGASLLVTRRLVVTRSSSAIAPSSGVTMSRNGRSLT